MEGEKNVIPFFKVKLKSGYSAVFRFLSPMKLLCEAT